MSGIVADTVEWMHDAEAEADIRSSAGHGNTSGCHFIHVSLLRSHLTHITFSCFLSPHFSYVSDRQSARQVRSAIGVASPAEFVSLTATAAAAT